MSPSSPENSLTASNANSWNDSVVCSSSEQAGLEEVQHAREELAPREVARRAEENHGHGLVCRLRHVFHSASRLLTRQ
jgi:hypothetical protein